MTSRWMDHLPAWLALLALAGTGIYEPAELAFMALPLVAALSVELHRTDLSRWRLPLEVLVLAVFVTDIFLFRNLFAALVHLLCVISGLRLALPRQPRERRQLLLTSFLLFLTTAISTSDMLFLVLALLWSMGAMALLVQISWEQGAHLRRGLPPRAPFRKLPLWLGASVLLGAVLFVAMPRATLGFRPLPALQRRILGSTAGLGDDLDLAKEGPIQDNDAVALRITPRGPLDGASRARTERDLALLKGLSLEAVRGLRWEASASTPFHEGLKMRSELEDSSDPEAEFFVSPSRTGILPLPYGTAWFRQPLPVSVRPGEGGGLRWAFLTTTGLPLKVGWRSGASVPDERGGLLAERRRLMLTSLGPEHESARRKSLEWAPDDLPAQSLATRLEAALQQRCSYTLDNPSGGATNPLAHFLEVSHAGHCEYFASALALMLRARGVPARVATGYRLGPWIPEGGYFLVTQNQAHAWVEFWDDASRRWIVADPTPSAPLAAADASSLKGWDRALDALRYRWDRFVVRFSDQDQMEGLSWAQAHFGGFRPARPRLWAALAGLLLASLLAWRTRKLWWKWLPAPAAPGGLAALRPLLRRVGAEAPPGSGETARAWLLRLADLRPGMAADLKLLAQTVDAHAYGGGPDAPVRAQAKALAKLWRSDR
jgi:hypothetical protein